MPDAIVKRMTMVVDNLKYAVGGYFKAQFKIMAVVFAILLAGFSIAGVHFSILLALAIAFLDFLPFFGTGTALIPWALYKFMVGDYKMVVALVVIYAVSQLVRQLIQPKLVGDSMGLNPLFTLALLYVGYKIGSVLGMIFAVPVGLIQKAGITKDRFHSYINLRGEMYEWDFFGFFRYFGYIFGDSAGCGRHFFCEKGGQRQSPVRFPGLCRRSDGGGFCVVTAASGN